MWQLFFWDTVSRLVGFLGDLTNWYVRLNRSRLKGNDGEDSDAMSAYTQVLLEQALKLLAKNDPSIKYVETWVSLPRNRRPKSWDNIEDPVCKLRLNLYGHPLAGLLWEKHCNDAIFKAGFEKMPGWECLFFHREKQLF